MINIQRIIKEIRKILKYYFTISSKLKTWNGETIVDKGVQILLNLKYQELLYKKLPLPSFDQVQFRNMSQNGEDGILLYIFSLINVTNKKVVEICAGDGVECNAANLIVNHGWIGLLMDGDKNNIAIAKAYYNRSKDTHIYPPTIIQAWITRDNINKIITEYGFIGEIDLLSIDLDGNDYWIWKAIDCISPRVVVIEYNSLLAKDKSVTIPYDPNFTATFINNAPAYSGASLKAFIKLANKKGYRFVGVERYGFNAFFVKNELAKSILPTVGVEEGYKHPKNQDVHEEKMNAIRNKKWVNV